MRNSNKPFDVDRRRFLKIASGAAGVIAVPTLLPAISRHSSQSQWVELGVENVYAQMDSSIVEHIVTSIIDEARRAGALYAEARVTRTVSQSIGSKSSIFGDSESYAIGVRALINGAWGFSASTHVNINEGILLARQAVEQAKINAAIFPRKIEIGSYPLAKGSWTTPIRIDPFSISIEEKVDYLRALESFFHSRKMVTPDREVVQGEIPARFVRQERVIANTENSLFRQVLFSGQCGTTASGQTMRLRTKGDLKPSGSSAVAVTVKGVHRQAGGWEIVLDANIREQIPALIDEAERNFFVSEKPVDVGRYEIVADGEVVASLIANTLGDATQLDRALGYEANAGGTSYLGPDPQNFLGTNVGGNLLNVSADRSSPKGLATVKWDDEGVEPKPFSIIENGVLVDYQTTREQAFWLSDWYNSAGRPIRSNGCSVASSALNFPMQHTPNLSISPGTENLSFEDMVRQTSRGLAFISGGVSTDFQSRSGDARGVIREIVDGELGDILKGAGVLFESLELWKNLIQVGGVVSEKITPSTASKGQPAQGSSYSMKGVAARFKDMSVIDLYRKA